MKFSFKKAISVLLAAVLMLGALPVCASAAAGDGYIIRFWLDDEKTVQYGDELEIGLNDAVEYPADPADGELPYPGTYFDSWDILLSDTLTQDDVDTYFVEDGGIYYCDVVAISNYYEYSVSIFVSGLSWQDENEPTDYFDGMYYGDELYEEDMPFSEYEGLTFGGWTMNGKSVEFPVVITEDIVIRGVFEPMYYNAVFNANGGLWQDENGDYCVEEITIPVAYEDQISAPDTYPEREGYSIDESMPWDPELGIMDVEDQYFYANWIPNDYQITFEFNGQSVQTVQTYGKYISLPDEVVTEKDGYIFKGWENQFTSEFFEDITQCKVPAYYATFAAVYEPDPAGVDYTVEIYFMNLDGAYELEEETVLNGLAGEEAAYAPDACEGFAVNAGLSVAEGIIEGDGSTVLKIYYDRNKYTVTVDGAEEEYYYGAELAQPEDPEKDGYVFLGWKYEDGTDVAFPVTVSDDIVIASVWEKLHVHVPVVITVEPDCTNDGKTYTVCDECGEVLSDITVLPATGHSITEITVEPDCTNGGERYDYCTVCEKIIGEKEIFPETGHTPAEEWEIVTEPALGTDGLKIKRCAVCGEIAEQQTIAALRAYADTETGISIVYSPDDFDGEVSFRIEAVTDSAVNALINSKVGLSDSVTYKIELLVDGEAQQSADFELSIPVPADFDASQSGAYILDVEADTAEKLDAAAEDGVITVSADKSGLYSVIAKYTGEFEIREPSTTTIKYGDAIIMHADFTVELPEGAYIEWSCDNGNFKLEASEDGLTCKITPEKNGKATVTAKVYDSSDNEIFSDEQEMTSKAGILWKIIAFFKRIFRLTKTFPESFLIK